MVFFSNIIGFDGIIFLLAIVNVMIFLVTKKSVDELHDKMHVSVFVPGKKKSQAEVRTELDNLRESDIISMRSRMGRWYSVFINITGIFPLLGILGTVTSLLGLVNDMSDVQGSFYSALTSTFWGIIFAIGFKFADGFISSKIEENEKDVALYLERNSVRDSDPPEYYQ